MDAACGNYAELVACDEIDSDNVLINGEIIEDRACGIKYEDTSVDADRISILVLRNSDDIRTDVGVIKDAVLLYYSWTNGVCPNSRLC